MELHRCSGGIKKYSIYAACIPERGRRGRRGGINGEGGGIAGYRRTDTKRKEEKDGRKNKRERETCRQTDRQADTDKGSEDESPQLPGTVITL